MFDISGHRHADWKWSDSGLIEFDRYLRPWLLKRSEESSHANSQDKIKKAGFFLSQASQAGVPVSNISSINGNNTPEMPSRGKSRSAFEKLSRRLERLCLLCEADCSQTDEDEHLH